MQLRSRLFKASIISLALLICLGIIIVINFFSVFFSLLCNFPINISSSLWVLAAHHNLKYYGQKNSRDHVAKSLKNKFCNFKVWCAASTHNNEEILIGKLHKKLKKKEKKLITIIIPRHINRTNEIIGTLNNLN